MVGHNCNPVGSYALALPVVDSQAGEGVESGQCVVAYGPRVTADFAEQIKQTHSKPSVSAGACEDG